jgi:hypothetical protein
MAMRNETETADMRRKTSSSVRWALSRMDAIRTDKIACYACRPAIGFRGGAPHCDRCGELTAMQLRQARVAAIARESFKRRLERAGRS